jgi:hypothetical protein
LGKQRVKKDCKSYLNNKKELQKDTGLQSINRKAPDANIQVFIFAQRCYQIFHNNLMEMESYHIVRKFLFFEQSMIDQIQSPDPELKDINSDNEIRENLMSSPE